VPSALRGSNSADLWTEYEGKTFRYADFILCDMQVLPFET
jgi:hypothetical protein